MHTLNCGSTPLTFELKRSSRKTLGIQVYPDAQVLVTAPKRAGIKEIYKIIVKRAGWIFKKQLHFQKLQTRPEPKRFINGEVHYYLGKPYMLQLVEACTPSVTMEGDTLCIMTPEPTNAELTAKLLGKWYMQKASALFNERLQECLTRFDTPALFTPSKLTIKLLKSRWGSMTCQTKRMVLNLKLIHTPLECIDYVIVHELCHIQVPNHSKAFWNLVETITPDWKLRRKQLNGYTA